MRAFQIASILLSLPIGLVAQTATPTAFLTTIGKDTFCLEQYTRSGNVISGTWVVLHPPGVYVHDYRITLDDNGVPARYLMVYSTPGAAQRPDLDSVTVTYGRDSAKLVFFIRDSLLQKQVAMHEAFPLLGQSYVGVELALMRLRRMHMDSSTITLHAPSEPNRPIMVTPVRFFGGDSAVVGGAMRLQVASDGSILGLRAGPAELHRVEPFETSTLVDGFVKSFASRAAANAAAAASRVEITLAATQLDQFVGDYTIAGATVAVTREGAHLVLQLPRQPAIQLLAMSPTQFFVRKPDLVVTFESDSTGRVTALTLSQGDAKQRLERVK